MSFENKVVIVTGAASGIGAAIALRFAKLSAHVALVDRDEAKLLTSLAACEEESDNKHLAIVADLSKEEDVNKVVPETIARFKKLDVLVNSAAVLVKENLLGEDIAEKFDTLMTVNLKAPVVLTSKSAPYLTETKGNIVNIASVRSSLPAKGAFLYCMSKSALEMFTKCSALELAPKGVRVNSVNPGFVKTNIYNQTDPSLDLDKVYSDIEKRLPFGVIQPEEVAKLVTFLASEDGRSITGSSYYIEGGMLLSEKQHTAEN